MSRLQSQRDGLDAAVEKLERPCLPCDLHRWHRMWDARKSLVVVVGWRSQTRPSRTSWNGCLACISLGAHRPRAARAGWKMRAASLVSSDCTAAAMLETRHSERQKFSNGINERTERQSSEWASKTRHHLMLIPPFGASIPPASAKRHRRRRLHARLRAGTRKALPK